MTDTTYDGMSVTHQLILEVLAARSRTGETWWVFTHKARRSANILERLGYIELLSGMDEFSFRARLTDAGLKLMHEPEYVPPVLR